MIIPNEHLISVVVSGDLIASAACCHVVLNIPRSKRKEKEEKSSLFCPRPWHLSTLLVLTVQ